MSDYKPKYSTPYEKNYTILDDSKLVLSCFVKDRGVSRMNVEVFNGSPQLVFKLFSNKNKADNEFFTARFQPLDFQTFLESILEVINHKPVDDKSDYILSVDNYIQNRENKEIKFDIKIVVGKDSTKGVYIGAVKEGFEPRRYYFRSSQFHKWQLNRVDVDPVAQSEREARAWVKVIEGHVGYVQRVNYNPPTPKNNAKPAVSASTNNTPPPSGSISEEDFSW